MRFTPSKFGQRSPPTYYRGCWHVVSRGFFCGYRLRSSPLKGVYTPKGFVLHAASLGQACAHCPKFPTAASRRSGARVSVPLGPIILSDRLPVVGLVSRYLTNNLIGRGPIPKRLAPLDASAEANASTPGISPSVPELSQSSGQVTPVLLRRSPLSAPRRTPPARLACLRHAASVRPEPGSNSPSENAIPAEAGSFSKVTGLAKRSYLPGFQGSITACRPCSKRTRQHAFRHFVGDSDYTTSQARLSRA